MKLLSLAVVLALSFAPASAKATAGGQDKITLKFNPKQGDKFVKTDLTEMSIKSKVVAQGQEQELQIDQKQTQKSKLEYVEVTGGAVTKAVLVCEEDLEERKGPPSNQWDKKERSMHGRKVTMSMKDGALVREGAEGLDEKQLKKLDLFDRTSLIYPKTPVGPGDSWEVQGEDVRRFLGADGDLREAKIKLTLVEVKDIDGKRCAVLKAVLELVGKAKGDVDIATKLDADVIVWIERGYALSVKGKGIVTMKAENAQFSMKGEGPMTLEKTLKLE